MVYTEMTYTFILMNIIKCGVSQAVILVILTIFQNPIHWDFFLKPEHAKMRIRRTQNDDGNSHTLHRGQCGVYVDVYVAKAVDMARSCARVKRHHL